MAPSKPFIALLLIVFPSLAFASSVRTEFDTYNVSPGSTIAVNILITGGGNIQGANIGMAIGDGGPYAGGTDSSPPAPIITNATFSTGIFAGNNTGDNFSVQLPDMVVFSSTTTQQNTVDAAGPDAVLARLVLSIPADAAGDWRLTFFRDDTILSGSQASPITSWTGAIIHIPCGPDNTACGDANACTVNDTCVNGTCVGSPRDCDDGRACTIDTCDIVTGCVHTPVVCTDNNVCNGIETCDEVSGCRPGTPLNCDDGNPCTDDACDPLNGCSHVPNDNNPCSDGNACTQGDTCQNGTCVSGNPVVCPAPSLCHQRGTCDPQTGMCSNPILPNGFTCNDANACTQTDKCQNGNCVGTPVVCTPQDQCHDATCDPQTGLCSNAPKPNGSPCNEGDLCTQGDTCQNGTCVAGNPLVCPPPDQCHNPGTCVPQFGICSYPNKSNGTACNDGNPCTSNDKCQLGNCAGTQITCTPQDQCHTAGTCDPQTGLCSNPPKTNGATCNDGNACTQGDTCQNGTCTGGNPVVCTALDQCHVAGECVPPTGCTNPIKSDGSTCDDGLLCTVSDSCSNGSCIGTQNCDDGDPATSDCCSRQSGQCEHSASVPGIVSHHIFYNNSFYDSNGTNCRNLVGLPECNDNTAIATDKTPLLPGVKAGFVNYISYFKSINGIMVDIRHPGNLANIGADDFIFRIGNTSNPTNWIPAAAPVSVTPVVSGGQDCADRITIIWANNAIPNTRWLQVTVLANADTGLPSSDVHYWGIAIGESNTPGSTRAIVSTTDEIDARNHPHNSLNRVPVATNSTYGNIPADAIYDYDKSGVVSSSDEIIARNNPTNSLNGLLLITPPP